MPTIESLLCTIIENRYALNCKCKNQCGFEHGNIRLRIQKPFHIMVVSKDSEYSNIFHYRLFMLKHVRKFSHALLLRSPDLLNFIIQWKVHQTGDMAIIIGDFFRLSFPCLTNSKDIKNSIWKFGPEFNRNMTKSINSYTIEFIGVDKPPNPFFEVCSYKFIFLCQIG